MNEPPPGTPVFRTPAQMAEIFPGKMANWFKVQARSGAIPCTRLGRTIMFSEADLAEIARMSQQRPRPAPLAGRTPRRKQAAASRDGEPVLKAKVPPRKRKAALCPGTGGRRTPSQPRQSSPS